MIKAYKFRLYPSKDQEVLLSKHFGCNRLIYNWALDYKTKKYKETKENIHWMKLTSCEDFFNFKKEHEFLKETNSQSLISSIGNLDRAYKNFFEGRADFPKFKSKSNHQSFQVPQHGFLDSKNNKLYIPKFKEGITCVFHRKLPVGKQGTYTISKNPAGRYFVSIIVDVKEQLPEKAKINKVIGLDFGLKTFITTSDGVKINSPEYLKQSLTKLQKLSKKHSKKQKGSKNNEKERLKLAKLHEKISNQRNDFLHKLSSKFIKENQFDLICIENLNLKGMSKLWGRKVNDLSYFSFTQMLLYKSVWYGKTIIKINRFDPSSQVCSKCGNIQKLELSQRTYNCTKCNLSIDRDINAAINIRDFGYNQYLVPQELRDFKPLEKKALAKRNRKKSNSETSFDEEGKKIRTRPLKLELL